MWGVRAAFRALRLQVRLIVLTGMVPPLVEDDFLQHAVLPELQESAEQWRFRPDNFARMHTIDSVAFSDRLLCSPAPGLMCGRW